MRRRERSPSRIGRPGRAQHIGRAHTRRDMPPRDAAERTRPGSLDRMQVEAGAERRAEARVIEHHVRGCSASPELTCQTGTTNRPTPTTTATQQREHRNSPPRPACDARPVLLLDPAADPAHDRAVQRTPPTQITRRLRVQLITQATRVHARQWLGQATHYAASSLPAAARPALPADPEPVAVPVPVPAGTSCSTVIDNAIRSLLSYGCTHTRPCAS